MMIPLLAALLQAPAAAAPLAPSQIVERAPAAAWADIAGDDLLVIDLAGNRRVVIQLAPDAFAPVHLANVRALARSGWWDGTSINRVQDNYVVQWGGATGTKPLPQGVVARPPAEYERAAAGVAIRTINSPDPYADKAGFAGTWPVAVSKGQVSLTHCYATVGVGREMPPDTGIGTELYAIIGQAPRQLDRNIAVVGRVALGMEHLSALPRGEGASGFYRDPAQHVPILRVRLASQLPAAERPRLQEMRTDAPAFDAYLAARTNRRDPFYIRPAGGIDICNAPVPIRAAP